MPPRNLQQLKTTRFSPSRQPSSTRSSAPGGTSARGSAPARSRWASTSWRIAAGARRRARTTRLHTPGSARWRRPAAASRLRRGGAAARHRADAERWARAAGALVANERLARARRRARAPLRRHVDERFPTFAHARRAGPSRGVAPQTPVTVPTCRLRRGRHAPDHRNRAAAPVEPDDRDGSQADSDVGCHLVQ